MIGVVMFAFGTLAALGIVLWQCFKWLRVGEWHTISVIDGLVMATGGSPDSWMLSPSSWIGLHKLLAMTPLALGVFLCGMLFLWLGLMAEKR